jgi:monoterpene epsilon-lactone hydrolase
LHCDKASSSISEDFDEEFLIMSSTQLQNVIQFIEAKRPASDAPLQKVREQFDDITSAFVLDVGMSVEQANIPGVRALWVRPRGATASHVLLFLHGGGYVVGSAEGFTGIAGAYAQAADANALVLDYRRAPENPYPAAVDDAYVAYQWLLDQGIASGNIGLVGDSAGGGLCMALLGRLLEGDLLMPGAVALISPWIDLAAGGESMNSKASVDPMLTRDAVLGMAKAYLRGGSIPAALKPLEQNLANLPPLMIQVGSWEVLLDDATRLAAYAASYDVSVTLKVWPGMVHDWPLFAPMLDEGWAAIGEIGLFLRHHLTVL